jgi:hypothetical protein
MNYLTLIHHLDTAVQLVSKLYALGGELFSITAMLWCLNIIASMIKKTYQAGYAIGSFYRQYLHQHCKWVAIHLVALIVLIIQMFWEGCMYIYQNRQKYYKVVNDIRNDIGMLFAYRYLIN